MRAFAMVKTLFSLLGLSAFFHAENDRILKLKRPGKSPLFYLATVPRTAKPTIGVVLFAGGDGVVDLADKGIPQPGSNFLIRSRSLFAERDMAVATFDPGRGSTPLTDEKRMSALHVEEIEAVLTDFKNRFGLVEIYLVGTSRGTISAAYSAVRLQERIDGVVLASAVFSASHAGPGLDGFDYSRIRVPLLFVHHRRDACKVSPPGGAENMSGRFPVVFIDGGEEANGDACGPYGPHGYQGREREAVGAMSDWILSRKPTADGLRSS